MCWVRVSVLGVGVGECAGCGCGRVCWVWVWASVLGVYNERLRAHEGLVKLTNNFGMWSAILL